MVPRASTQLSLVQAPTPNPKGYPFSGMTGTPHEGDWGVIPGLAEADYDDANTVDYAIDVLGRKQDRPFFLACGIFRPHLPWYAPQRFSICIL